MSCKPYVGCLLIFFINISLIMCWTDEDLQLFDLVENTDRKFYDILGVNQKASASEIRKAYRKLSQQYHPDRNKESNAEEMFRKIAAISEVLRNDELRKKYDIILQTGLPDWREPIYYYRRVRNMGLIELIIFLFCLATVGQHLFAWSVYWERKYEIEEIFSSRLRKKAKQQRRGRNAKSAEEPELASEEIANLPKPRYQDLFPVRLVCFAIHVIKSSPSYVMFCIESLQFIGRKRKNSAEETTEEEVPPKREHKPKTKKHFEPIYPELSTNYDEYMTQNDQDIEEENLQKQEQSKASSEVTESNLNEFKKALKKFPNGTLQRWEKIAEYLNCPVSKVTSMAKQMKCQQFNKNVPIAAQGLTGINDFQNINYDLDQKLETNGIPPELQNGETSLNHRNGVKADAPKSNSAPEIIWRQEEQRLLEMALQMYPKDVSSRWEHISQYVESKTKEECISRYKWLAQEIRRKKERSEKDRNH